MSYPPHAHEQLSELVGAYALGAVSESERVALEAHLVTCEICQAELASYGSPVANLQLAAEGAEPSALLDRLRVEGSAARSGRMRTWQLLAAALTVLVLGIGVGTLLGQRDDQRVRDRLATVEDRLELLDVANQPAAQRIRLSGADRFADLVVLPDGRGVLWSDNLTPLAEGRAYQLWGEVDGALVATTDLGRDPDIVAVSVPTDALDFVITESRAGNPMPADRATVSGSRDPG
ncbi:MAG: zf-HC2 domain-containing protein [Acidimicrobiia bacterium]|nr:zf-HC2 domain-containing protein [Acidimicrobiia bacterium]